MGVRRYRIGTITTAAVVCSLYLLYPWTSAPDYYPPHFNPQPALAESEPFNRTHIHPLPEKYPVSSVTPLPGGLLPQIPKVQATPPAESSKRKKERLRRLRAVKRTFNHAWDGYVKEAWLRDEVAPISGGYKDTFGGWAATLVDSLDTLWIMGMKEDFEIAVQSLGEIDFTSTDSMVLNIFETTIRYLGGFLAAYDLSEGKYPILLEKAIEVGDMIMCCFDTPNRMPISRWNWGSYMEGASQTAPSTMLVSEIGSFSLELTRLAQITGNNKYYDAVARIANELAAQQSKTKLPGMWPVVVDASVPRFTSDNVFTLGGMSDSLYEYLPKNYLLHGGRLEQPRSMYESFIDVAKKHMFFRPLNPHNLDILISGDVRVNSATKHIDMDPRGQHLTCFVGGMVGLGAKIFNREHELAIAAKLTDGCVWTYDSMPTGIGPELYTTIPCNRFPDDPTCAWSKQKWYDGLYATFRGKHSAGPQESREERVKAHIETTRLVDGFTSIDDRRYILRPEAIESVFIMYRLTGDPTWQDKAWRMFTAVEKYTRTDLAASAIDDVTNKKPKQVNSMESFWLAETLKYFYLCFEEMDVVSLDEFVLNTEAHALRRPTSD